MNYHGGLLIDGVIFAGQIITTFHIYHSSSCRPNCINDFVKKLGDSVLTRSKLGSSTPAFIIGEHILVVVLGSFGRNRI
jgi:hypothetical protein